MGKLDLQRFDDYDVNYNDERFVNVNNEKVQKVNESNSLYDSMINQSDKFYNQQAELAKNYGNKQTELQKASTEQTIKEINQNKDQTYKDYEKEQRGAYTDYQKAISNYGVNAENLASNGLQNSGYSESSRINAFNTYQNRYAVARASYDQAVQNYNNQITKARLNLDTNLAEIAYNSMKQQLEYALQGFQAKNELLLQKANKQSEIENTYYGRWQDVLSQINNENQFRYQRDQDEKEYNLALEKWNFEKQQALAAASGRSSSGSSRSSSKKSSGSSSSGTSYSDTSSNTENTTANNSVDTKNVNLLYQRYTEPSIANTKPNLRADIFSKVKKGAITDAEAQVLYKKLKLD